MAGERSYTNIVNFRAGENTASQAILQMMGDLKSLQAIARETGLSMEASLFNRQMTGVEAQASSLKDRLSKAWKDITMGGLPMPVGGIMPGTAQEYLSTPMTQAKYAAQLASDAPRNAATMAQMQSDIQARMKVAQVGDWENQSVNSMTQLKSVAAQYYAQTGQNLPILQQQATELENVGKAAKSSGYDLGSHVRGIAVGMLVWQAANTVMTALGDTINTVATETSRLDDTSARLSVTLNTSKENARSYAQALNIQGIGFGLAPEQTQALGYYASRVNKTPQGQQDLLKTAAMMGQVTGEDPKKLIDDLNVTSKQTGLSVTQLGDMSVKAFNASGTSASEYLNILREIGPLAKESGIDIDRMAGIAAQAADRMGGSMSDAANTLTRLIKAVQDPNTAQKDVLLRYGIGYGPGQDVQKALDQISKAGMSATDMAALGGRPGQPAVANDIRTIISVFKEYKGELSSGIGLQDSFAKSTDSIKFATERLDASWKTYTASVMSSKGVLDFYKSLADVLEGAAKSQEYMEKHPGLAGRIGQAGGLYPKDTITANPYQGGMYQPGMQGQTMAQAAAATTSIGQIVDEAKKQFVPSFIPDFSNTINVSKYTNDQYQRALGMTGGMFTGEVAQQRKVYQQAGIPQESIDKLIEEFRQKVSQSNAIVQSNGQMGLVQGAQAYYLQMALQSINTQDEKQSRLASLQEHLADLRRSLEELDDTEKKRAQLEGQWNIPAGARLLVPLTAESQRLIKEHGGETEDQAKERRRQQILREIAATEEKIRKEQEAGPALDKSKVTFDNLSSSTSNASSALDVFSGKLYSSMLAVPQPGAVPAGATEETPAAPRVVHEPVHPIVGPPEDTLQQGPASAVNIAKMNQDNINAIMNGLKALFTRPTATPDAGRVPSLSEANRMPAAFENTTLRSTIQFQPNISVTVGTAELVNAILPEVEYRMSQRLNYTAQGEGSYAQ